MDARLQAIIDEFQSASDRLQHLVEVVPNSRWAHRADPNRWSVAECVAHLNLTGEVYLPLLRQALEDGRQRKDAAPARYRFDPVGWLLWRSAQDITPASAPAPVAGGAGAWYGGDPRLGGNSGG